MDAASDAVFISSALLMTIEFSSAKGGGGCDVCGGGGGCC